MKKTGLFKIICFILIGITVLSWILSASYFESGSIMESGMYNLGFFDVFQLLFGSFEFQYFIQIFLLLISIGALYGVLNKTGKYRAWIERIVNNLKGAEIVFLLATAFLIAAITSVFDYGFAIFIFFPLLISIILAMGYDKITACVATFGAILVGTIGSTLGYNVSGVNSQLLGTELSDGIIFKIGMLVMSLAALFYFLSTAKRKKKDIKNEEIDMFLGEKSSNKHSVAPIIVIFSILFVLLVLGCTNWTDTFNVQVFQTLHTSITEFTVKLPYFHITTEGLDYGMNEVAIFGKLLGTVSALGSWYYAEMAVMSFLAAIVIGWLYKIKTSDIFTYMADGAKKMLKPALMVIFTYTIIYFAGNTMFFPTISYYLLGITNKFNVFFTSIDVILGSSLYVDYLYASNYMLPQISALTTNTKLLTVIFQGFYGVTMFIAPTSAMLVLGLNYLGISYKEWVKSTWKLVLLLLAVVIVATIILMFI